MYFCLTNGQINGCVQTRRFACVQPVLHQLDKDLLCECLEANTRGAETFKILNNFTWSRGWPWSTCAEMCAADAGHWWLLLLPWPRSEQGHSDVPEATVFFTGMLAVKQGPDSLKGILDETVKSDHFYEIFTLDFTSFWISSVTKLLPTQTWVW